MASNWVDRDDAREWAEVQAAGVRRTLTSSQHLGLVEYLDRQAHGGPDWGPNWWTVVGWAKPTTTGRLSQRMRIRLQNRDDRHDRRTLVWWNTLSWKRLKA